MGDAGDRRDFRTMGTGTSRWYATCRLPRFALILPTSFTKPSRVNLMLSDTTGGQISYP